MFFTNIKIKTQEEQTINYQSSILLLGSCFSENIGEKFKHSKFNASVNPFGILFNPIAIEQFIDNVLLKHCYKEKDLIFSNNIWQSFDAHSKLSSTKKDEVLTNLNHQINQTYKNLKTTSHIVITLGTSWVYWHVENHKVVANCHKINSKKFNKKLLSIKEIIESLDRLITNVKKTNPKVSFLFTVSPVRHLKDGVVENSRSKSHLISAIHTIIETHQRCHYFPSFEIMMDELRDYRYYKDDMIHPSSLAIDHIWNLFKKTWIGKSTLSITDQVEDLQKQRNHKILNPKSASSIKFTEKLEVKIRDFESKFPFIKF